MVHPINSTVSSSTPLLSIIVPVYNIEPIVAYFTVCITSVRTQTLDNIEIIIVDDGSTDGTHQYISEVASQDERIVVIRHTHNRGLGPARNSATARARGEYIWYVDGDDFIPPTACALLVKQIEQQECPDALWFGFRPQREGETFADAMRACINCIMPKPSTSVEVLNGEHALKRFFARKINHNSWSRITRTKLARTALFETISFEDAPHSLHICAIAQRVVILPYHLYVYRVHAASIMAPFRKPGTSTGGAEYAQACHAIDRIIAHYRLDTCYPQVSARYRLHWRLRHMQSVLDADDVIHDQEEWHDLFTGPLFSVRFLLRYFCGRLWHRPWRLIDRLILALLFRSSSARARRYYRWR